MKTNLQLSIRERPVHEIEKNLDEEIRHLLSSDSKQKKIDEDVLSVLISKKRLMKSGGHLNERLFFKNSPNINENTVHRYKKLLENFTLYETEESTLRNRIFPKKMEQKILAQNEKCGLKISHDEISKVYDMLNDDNKILQTYTLKLPNPLHDLKISSEREGNNYSFSARISSKKARISEEYLNSQLKPKRTKLAEFERAPLDYHKQNPINNILISDDKIRTYKNGKIVEIKRDILFQKDDKNSFKKELESYLSHVSDSINSICKRYDPKLSKHRIS